MTDTRPTQTASPEPAADLGAIVVLNRDLLFGSRMTSHLRPLGYAVVFARDAETFADLVRSLRPGPVLGIIDMNSAIAWPAIRGLVDDPAVATPLLGFGPHVDVAGRRAAKAAGLARIVSNGEFHRDLVALVRRYAR